MMLWKTKSAIFAAVLIAALGFAKLVQKEAQIPVVNVPGGTYKGELPGFGVSQLDLFLGDDDFMGGWLYREGLAGTSIVSLRSNSPTVWEGEIHGDNYDTNALIRFQFRDDGRILEGRIENPTNAISREFVLTRAFQNRAIKARSGLRFGRLGAYTSFSGEFPQTEIAESPPGLNEQVVLVVKSEARRFTSGNLERQWDNLRWGQPFTEGRQPQQWQPRLVTKQLASFYVWSYPDYGGNGNLNVWAGRNFWWHRGRLQEFNLKDLFRKETNWEMHLRCLCAKALARDGFGHPSIVLDPAIPVDVFTLSATGLQICFNPYTIGSGADGEFVVHIPFADLSNYLRRDGPASALPASTAPRSGAGNESAKPKEEDHRRTDGGHRTT